MKNNYKLSRYAIISELDDGIIVYSTLNGSMTFFNEIEYINLMKKLFKTKDISKELLDNNILFKKLYESQIILDFEVNEIDIANSYFLNKFKYNTTLKLIIYVTNDCNFKCVYCPQNHTLTYMNNETMDSLLNMVENMICVFKYENILISWFGGEPLLNINIIERGMKSFIKLSEKYSITLSSGITTNGYLLSKKYVEKLFALRVFDYQITLDGFEQEHNKNRVLKNGNGTWQVIWDNLISMSLFKEKFSVNLRINVNIENINNVLSFINFVKSNLDNRYTIKIHPIMNMGNKNSDVKYCSTLESQIIQLSLYDFMSKNNIEDVSLDFVIAPFGLMCNCSDPNYYVIKENGMICKCELQVNDESNVFGYINNEKIKIDSLKMSTYITLSTEKTCLKCKFYPLCFGLACPYKRFNNQDCLIKDTLLIEEYLKSIAQKLIRRIL